VLRSPKVSNTGYINVKRIFLVQFVKISATFYQFQARYLNIKVDIVDHDIVVMEMSHILSQLERLSALTV
jgi:hypothetical protein